MPLASLPRISLPSPAHVLILLLALGTVVAALACSAAGQEGTKVTAAEYGEDWPFPDFENALLKCETKGSRPLVTVKLGDAWYGLNGAAMGVGGYPDAREKMARHPEWDTYELGATDELIKRGLKICR